MTISDTPINQWCESNEEKRGTYGCVGNEGQIYFSEDKGKKATLANFFKSAKEAIKTTSDQSPQTLKGLEKLRDACRTMYAETNKRTHLLKKITLLPALFQLRSLEKKIASQEQVFAQRDPEAFTAIHNLNWIIDTYGSDKDLCEVCSKLKQLICIGAQNPQTQQMLPSIQKITEKTLPNLTRTKKEAYNNLKSVIEKDTSYKEGGRFKDFINDSLSAYQTTSSLDTAQKNLQQLLQKESDNPLYHNLKSIFEELQKSRNEELLTLLSTADSPFNEIVTSLTNTPEKLDLKEHTTFINVVLLECLGRAVPSFKMKFGGTTAVAYDDTKIKKFILESYTNFHPQDIPTFITALKYSPTADELFTRFMAKNKDHYMNTASKDPAELLLANICQAYYTQPIEQPDTTAVDAFLKQLPPSFILKGLYENMTLFITKWNENHPQETLTFNTFLNTINQDRANIICQKLFPYVDFLGFPKKIRELMFKLHPDKLGKDATQEQKELFELLARLQACLSGKL